MLSIILFSFCILTLWVSHRLHDVYVHVVGREELQMRKKGKGERGPGHHIGPKFFFIIDLCAVVAIIWSLRSLGFHFASKGIGTLSAMLMTCVHFSVVIALWMILEGLHLKSYYQRLARATRSLKGEAARLAWKGPKPGLAMRGLTVAAIIWACVPLILQLTGFDLVSRADTPGSAALLFTVGFVLPLMLLGVVIAKVLLPLRRIVYRD